MGVKSNELLISTSNQNSLGGQNWKCHQLGFCCDGSLLIDGSANPLKIDHRGENIICGLCRAEMLQH